MCCVANVGIPITKKKTAVKLSFLCNDSPFSGKITSTDSIFKLKYLWRENHSRADSRLAPGQWETSLQSNAVSHWLGVNLDSALPFSSYWNRTQLCYPEHWIVRDWLWCHCELLYSHSISGHLTISDNHIFSNNMLLRYILLQFVILWVASDLLSENITAVLVYPTQKFSSQ